MLEFSRSKAHQLLDVRGPTLLHDRPEFPDHEIKLIPSQLHSVFQAHQVHGRHEFLRLARRRPDSGASRTRYRHRTRSWGGFALLADEPPYRCRVPNRRRAHLLGGNRHATPATARDPCTNALEITPLPRPGLAVAKLGNEPGRTCECKRL